jgi:signal transduction histidine kinase
MLQKVAACITDGNLTVRAKIKGKDEVANLAADFNKMTDTVVARMKESEKAAQQKQQFIDNLAHELKTPLTAIRGHAELLQNTKTTEEDLFVSTSHIIRNIDRIRTMSQKLLELALTRDKKIDFIDVPVSVLFKAAQDEFRLVLEDRRICLTAFCGTEIIRGDQALLQNLLFNLIDNAINASDTDSSITICSTAEGKTIVLQIIDEGIGIEKNDIENVFEPFFRTDFSRYNKACPNVGLGLALCKQIADCHNAKIVIFSEPHKKTEIKITFTT